VTQPRQDLTVSQMSAKNYSVTATMTALRAIFADNQDKSFEQRWALAKSSEAYRGFQIRCTATAKVLLAFAVPPLLAWRFIGRDHPAAVRSSWSTIVICGLYLMIATAASWKLGIKAADAKMRNPQRTQGSG
jgi:hypothetical protein